MAAQLSSTEHIQQIRKEVQTRLIGVSLTLPQFRGHLVRHSRPRFVLIWGVIAERGVPAPPVIEHLDIFKDVLLRVFTGRLGLMVYELTFECPEKAFNTGIVPAVTFAAHAGDQVFGTRFSVTTTSARIRRCGIGGRSDFGPNNQPRVA